jgi:serine-type D-Ala-D-Ala carboxypeptidase (penicillin-binding protein 5/6)
MIPGLSHRCAPALLAAAAWLFAPGNAVAIETTAKQALVVDYQTGSVLLEKNADESIHPASMTKLMTLYLLFELLKEGKVSLNDEFTVSRTAWARGENAESNMFVALGSRVKVEDLIRGIAVQSGNDACKVLAEGIAGSQAAFVDMMNKKAQEMGLDHSHFTNSDGIEDSDHQMTARDIVKLAEHVYADFPEYYHYFAEKEFVYNGIKQGNRNPLLYKNMGVDGLKTGHLQVAGFGLIASAERNGRRVFLLVDGLPSMRSRSDESGRLLDWAFQSFQNIKLAIAGDILEVAPVWYGSQDTVPLTVAKDLIATLPKRGLRDLRAEAVFSAPIPAPITAGQTLGKLVITASGSSTEVPLVAGTTVQKLGILGHAFATLRYLVLPPRYHVAEP